MKRTGALRFPTPRAPGSPIVRHAVVASSEGAVPVGAIRVAISSDGRVLATAGSDGMLHVVELEVGRVAFSVDLGAPIVDLAVTASSVIAAVGSEVRLVNGLAGRAQAPVKLDAPARAIAVSHDGSAIAALDVEGRVVVFRTLTGRRTTTSQGPEAWSVAFSADDRALRIGAEGTVYVASIVGGAPPPGAVSASTVQAVAVCGAPDARHTRIVRIRDGALQVGGRLLLDRGGQVDDVAVFDSIGDLTVVGDLRGWRVVGEGSGHATPPVLDVALHPGLTHAVIATADGAVELVELGVG